MTNTTNGSVLRVGAVCRTSATATFFEWPFSSPADGDEGRIYFVSRQPVPALPELGRPATEQTLAVPETQQRRIARQLPDPGRQRPGFGLD